MAQNYKTGLVITGDASGGIRAIKATDSELGKLNQGFDRGSRRSRQFNQDVNATSQGLAVLKRAAAPIAGAIAGMFAANTIQNQIDWGDQLQKTNLRIGASTEALSQYSYVAKLSGVEFGQLTNAWRAGARRISEAAEGTGTAVKALDDLGLSAQELNRLAPEDQFERIAEAMQSVEGAGDRAAMAQRIWGREGVVLTQIIAQGTDAIATMRAEADALGLTISQDTANAMASYNDEVDRLKFAAQGLSQTIAAEMVPSMTAGLQSANAFIQEVGGAEVVVGHLTDGAQVLAALLAGRYAGAFATATAAKLAATQQSIAYQMALARMAGVSATAAGAQASLAAATRGAGAAMALVGGPLGAAMIAGGAIYYFREELGLVAPKVQSATDRVDDMTSALDANSEAALKNARAMLEAEQQFQQFRQTQLAMDVSRQQQVVADEQRQWDAVGGQQAFGMGMRSEAQQKLRDLRLELLDTRNAIEEAGGSVTEIDEKLAQLEKTTRDTITPTADLGDASETAAAQAKELTESTAAQAKALEDLYNRLRPGRRETIQMARDIGTLNLAMATGTGNIARHAQGMQLLALEYLNAQDKTKDLADTAEDAGSRIANSFTTWGTIADNTLRNVDDTGRDAWLGLIDGSTSALDTVERAFEQTFANIAHMLTTQKLTFEVAGMMGLDNGAGGQQTRGAQSFGGMPSISSMMDGSGAIANAYRAFQGTGSSYAGMFGSELAVQTEGGLRAGFDSFAASGLGNAALGIGGGIAGGYAGTQLGSAVFGKEANSNYGAMAGAALGQAFIPIPGLGAFIGGGIGGALDSLFGSGRKSYGQIGSQIGGDDTAGDGVYRYDRNDRSMGWAQDSALGTVGVTKKQKTDDDLLIGTVAQVAKVDNLVASVMDAAQLEKTRAALDGWTSSKTKNIGTLFDERISAVVAATDSIFEGPLSALNGETLVQGLVGGLQVENVGGQMAAAVAADMNAEFRAALAAGSDIAAATQSILYSAQAVQTLGGAAERLGLQFDATAAGALDAAGNIANLVGGVDQLASLHDSYYQNFFTDAERAAHLQADLTAEFARYGAELPETREAFRELVNAQDQNTAAGQRNYAALLRVNSAFAELVPATDTAASSIENAADRVEQAGADLLAPVETAWQALNQSVDAERKILDAAHRDTTASIRSNMNTVQEAMRQTESVAQSLNNALRQTQSGTMYAREQGQATLRRMLAAGEITDQRELDNALSAVAEPSEQLFGSFLDYQRDFVGTAHDIYDLAQIADGQLSTEEQSLAALEKQLRTADQQHRQEMLQLDRLLMDQAAIIEAEFGTQDWLSSVNDSVLSVQDAINALELIVNISAPGGGEDGGSGGGGSAGGGGGGGGAGGGVSGSSGYTSDEIRKAVSDIQAANPNWDTADRAVGQAAINAGVSSSELASSLGISQSEVLKRAEELGLPKFRTGGIASGPESGYLAELHGREAIVPLPNGSKIPVEFRGPTAMPMPSLPPMPFFNQQRSADDMTVLIKRIETLTEQSKTQGSMQREALKALKAVVRQLERWDDQDRVRVSVEKTVEPTA